MSADQSATRRTSRSSGRLNMREVAEQAGVAMSSVSRVLSGHPDVSPVMRARVMATVDALGYQPDLLAQSLRRRATLTVGFVVGDIANPLFAEIVTGAEQELRGAGYSMLLANSDRAPDRDAAHIRLFEQRRVDGLLLSLAAEDDPRTLELLRKYEKPVVLVDREVGDGVEASVVLSDHRSGVRAATEELLALGHRRIGLILGGPMRPTRERRAGLVEAYEARGIDVPNMVVEGVLSAEHGRKAARSLLDRDVPPTALIAGGNQLLVGCLAELVDRGLRIGTDISLASCDAIPMTDLYQPPIAVVRRDNREIGRTAARLLLARLADDTLLAETVTLPTTWVRRASCGPVG